MNKLDTKILNIFRNLINSDDKYFVKLEFNTIRYNVGNVDIYLYYSVDCPEHQNEFMNFDRFTEPSCFEGINIGFNDKKPKRFYLTINNKSYKVPELDRVELARICNRLDKFFENIEWNTLSMIDETLAEIECDL